MKRLVSLDLKLVRVDWPSSSRFHVHVFVSPLTRETYSFFFKTQIDALILPIRMCAISVNDRFLPARPLSMIASLLTRCTESMNFSKRQTANTNMVNF